MENIELILNAAGHGAFVIEEEGQRVAEVIPLCPFVHAQFKRNPQQYADVWKKVSV